MNALVGIPLTIRSCSVAIANIGCLQPSNRFNEHTSELASYLPASRPIDHSGRI